MWSVRDQLPVDDLVVIGAVEPSDASFLDIALLRVELASSCVLIGRRRLNNEDLRDVRTRLTKFAFDVAEQCSSDPSSLLERTDSDEVQVPHSIRKRFRRVVRRPDDRAIFRLAHDEVMVVQCPVADAGDGVVNESSVVDAEHLGLDRDGLDRVDIHRFRRSDVHVISLNVTLYIILTVTLELAVSIRIPDLPILGEPLIPEFANTLYVDGPTRLDVLDHPAWINAWLRQAPCAAELAGPQRIRIEDAARLRVLRDALRGLLPRTGSDRTSDVETINEAAGLAVGRRQLVVAEDGELDVVNNVVATGMDRLLSNIALRVTESVDAGQFGLNQVCTRPGCNLFYFRDHHRRRYCNSRCANAHRQARYNTRLEARSKGRAGVT